MTSSNDNNETLYFDAVLEPHRALSVEAFGRFMLGLVAIGLLAGAVFAMTGAWPVLVFLCLDIALVYWAFKHNYLDASRYETVELTGHDLVVRHFTPSGRTKMWRFLSYWARVEFDGEDRLMLRSHGHTLEFGKFLTPGEKEKLCSALRDALKGVRDRHEVTRAIATARAAAGR